MQLGWLRRLFGDRGEAAAVRHLRSLGYTILMQNARSRLGEIDIIARDGNSVVFVEVKTRKSLAKGHPTEAITPTKQRQLTRAALGWLKQHRLLECRARFDVIAILWQQSAAPQIEHYLNAFEPAGDGQMYS